ncbi:MAG: trimethylamine methyltransferase family protein, partial [Cloacibacillus sp.]
MTFDEKLQKIHEASIQLLEKEGIRYPSPEALAIFRKHGAAVDGDIVKIDEKTLMKYVEKAPARFTIEARNPKYNVDMGSGAHYAIPAYGAPYVQDFDGSTRYSTLKDFVYFFKQIESLDDFNVNGGILCQPNEYEASVVTL